MIRRLFHARHTSRAPSSVRSPIVKRWIHQSKIRYAPTNLHNNNTPTKVHDAIIIGGGPSGLLLSNLLSSYNIHSHLLFDKRPESELLKHPQAHFINIRSMEILKSEVPNVYNGVLKEMPDVEEWEAFHFGGSVLKNTTTTATATDSIDKNDACGGRRLGRVIHPVREPLRVGQSGDAVLAPKSNIASGVDNRETSKYDNDNDGAPYVSSCRPAHLAQNKFVSLLLQEARRQHYFDNDDDDGNSNNRIRYGEEVISITEQSSSPCGNNREPCIAIQTSQGQTYHTRYLLAADGVQSFTRKHFNIPMMGDASMQNLINVHFRTNSALSKLLMHRASSTQHDHNQAMLHFVYNSQLVGAFVCHDGNKGEWVLQIPFFPPFQTMDDFDLETVRDMIWAGLLGSNIRPPQEDYNLDILSIRPWTMSSLVAQRYLNDTKTMMLVGDAAHAFPPAGGFGMNTGLQDAHNIAWRLALQLNNRRQNATTGMMSLSSSILTKYDEERRPVATQNAALSVRNYQRTLRIAKACYLDAQHPQLLIAMLNAPPMSLLPMEARQEMFRRLVKVAMMPLGSLTSSSRSSGFVQGGHADHIEKNVRSILDGGGSLPLVFPKFELGFAYSAKSAIDQPGDSAGYVPKLEVGHRMPHVLVDLLPSSAGEGDKGCGDFETLNQSEISLTDISSYMRQVHACQSPMFIALACGPGLAKSELASVLARTVDDAAKTWNVPIALVHVFPAQTEVSSTGQDNKERESYGISAVQAVDTQQTLHKLLQQHGRSTEGALTNALIMIRPDGHIANVSRPKERSGSSTLAEEVQQIVEEGLQNAIGEKLP